MQEIDPIHNKILPDAARRALAEAEERRRLADVKNKSHPLPREINGRKEESDPTRYGDWENKGIISDF